MDDHNLFKLSNHTTRNIFGMFFLFYYKTARTPQFNKTKYVSMYKVLGAEISRA